MGRRLRVFPVQATVRADLRQRGASRVVGAENCCKFKENGLGVKEGSGEWGRGGD